MHTHTYVMHVQRPRLYAYIDAWGTPGSAAWGDPEAWEATRSFLDDVAWLMSRWSEASIQIEPCDLAWQAEWRRFIYKEGVTEAGDFFGEIWGSDASPQID